MKRTTIKDIAKEAGVSIATVSYVINDIPGKTITTETRDRVLSIAKKLDYVADSSARAMQKGVSMNIGLICFWDMSGYGFMDIFESISRTASQHGYNIIFYTPANENKEYGYIDLYKRRLFDGMILISPIEYHMGFDEEKHIQTIRKAKIPAVILRGHAQDNKLNYIQFDFFDAAYKATEYLIKLNHKNIVYILPDQEELKQNQAIQRLNGYKAAMKDNSVALKSQNIVNFKDYEILINHILNKNGPSAIVVSKSEYAFEIINKMKDKNIKIPEDVSIIACNNTPYNRFTAPPLTGVQLLYKQMGSSAVDILIKSIKEGSENINIKTNNKVIERESCKRI